MDVTPYVPWAALAALVLLQLRARPFALEVSEGGASGRALGWVTASSVFLGVIHFALARGREARNVDECMYAATAEVFRSTGESVFSRPWNLSGQQLFFQLGDWAEPFLWADLAASVALTLTAVLLGLTLLRAGKGRSAAVLAAVLYLLGQVRFEGLTANKEPFVGLFLAAYFCVRLGVPDGDAPISTRRRVRRQLLAGACLGAAAVMKEQALGLLFVEPAIALLDRLRVPASTGARVRAFAVDEGLAALGFWGPVGLFLAGFAVHGQLANYVEFLTSWGGAGGVAAGVERGLRFSSGQAFPLAFLVGTSPWVLSPVGLVGLIGAIALLVSPRRLVLSRQRLSAGLAFAVLAGAACASIGARWFLHYLQLALPALAALAALGVTRAVARLKAGDLAAPGRLAALSLLGAAACLGLMEAGRLMGTAQGRAAASGQTMPSEVRARMLEVAAKLKVLTPPESRVLVWGNQAELYFAADRRPATRYVGPAHARISDALADLHGGAKPAAVVLTGQDGYVGEEDTFRLERHPQLREWLAEWGYTPVKAALPGDYMIWLAP